MYELVEVRNEDWPLTILAVERWVRQPWKFRRADHTARIR